jgi:hypothetical protein
MRTLIIWTALFSSLLVAIAAPAQAQQRKYMDAGFVQHQSGSVTVKADFPRPLLQAVTAVRKEYGWIVNYEDPRYFSSFELLDATDPDFRKSNPSEKGLIGIAGGSFQSIFQEPANVTSPSLSEEEAVLKKIVSDYNASGNPGKFAVRRETDNEFTIVGVAVKNEQGQDQPVGSILDTTITLPPAERNADDTINLIFRSVSEKTGAKLINRFEVNNLLLTSMVKIGGGQDPARSYLLRTLAATNRPTVWTFAYGICADRAFGREDYYNGIRQDN